MESIQVIKQNLSTADVELLPELLLKYAQDSRAGVIKLAAQYQKHLDALTKEKERIFTIHQFERQYADQGLICGVDEVGRGPLAGPVLACAVILPKDDDILYLDDSKRLSEKKREQLFLEIKQKAVAIGTGIIWQERIDEINILQATFEAMKMAIEDLGVVPAVSLNDAVTIPGVSMTQVPLVKGDQRSASIAAASIVAKVTRDHMMDELAKDYPEYKLDKNKGYGTKEHIDAIRQYGPCKLHRMTFLKEEWYH